MMKIIKGFLTVLFAAVAGLGNAGGTVRVRPEGHLKEFLSRQVSGLTGNRMSMGYPFDGCMWAGSIANVYFEEDLPYSRKVAAPRDEIWWPYEQAAYFLDGMMRLSRLIDAPELRSEFKRNLDWCIEHQAPDGDLFSAYSKSTCQWPMVVFFRAVLAYVEETGDERVKEAFVRHYAAKRNAPQGTDDRDVLNVEGMLKVAEWTGDRFYVTAAEDWFRKHHYCERFANTDRVHSHGVTFCEMLKLPMLLYKATGKAEWRELGIKAMRDVFRHNETPNGQVSACEYLSGRDPWEGSETCDAADMMCALSHFLDDPEVGCEAADHMERIAYNALPGATTKDFTAHQYISLPNQAVAMPFSHGGHFFYGEPDWNRFRVCHFAQCCSGNINRAMPLFVENSWRKGIGDRGLGIWEMPKHLLLGPGSVKGEGYEIVCETDYPFGDKLTYRFKVAGDDGREVSTKPPRTFFFRIPSWVASATVAKNGTPMNLAVRPGTLAKIEDAWQDGDTLEVVFDQPVMFHSDRHWHWLRRGALTLAHPVKTRCVREKPDAKFSDLSFEDPEPFNYAFDAARPESASYRTEWKKSDYPFETPNLVVKVPMREIREWQGLSEQRFTPPVPLYTHETGRTVTLDFVPYATTLTRITAFPDTVKRTALPVVRVYAAPECYDYDPKKPLSEQRGEPEGWTDEEFCDKGADVQRSPDLWTDCEAQYLANKGKFAYLLFRFWSDREGPVTCALGASRCVQAFVGGKEVYANGPIVEGRMVAPFWFSLDAKKGYNFLKVKVATNGKEKVFGQDQYRREWGAKLDVFRTESDPLERRSDVVPSLETEFWQSRIDACAAQGGGRVVVPPGIHAVGQLYLRNNVELHLEEGAVLEGAAGLQNYVVHRLPYSEGDWCAVVMGLNVTNVAITGGGEIFGNGASFEPVRTVGVCGEGFRPRGVFFSESKDIRLEDFSLRDAACWGIVFKCCEGVVARRVRIDSNVNRNNDGFDIEAKGVLIEGCEADTSDDAFCIKSNNPDFVVEDIRIRGCTARSHCNGFKVGTATHGTIRRVRFERCRAEAPRRIYRDLAPMPKCSEQTVRIEGVPEYLCGMGISAICIECVDGGLVEDIVVDDINVSGFKVPLFVRGGARSGRKCGIPPGERFGLRDIRISRVRGRAEAAIASSISGCGRCRPKKVLLSDIDIVCLGEGRSSRAVSEPGAEFDGCYPEATMFGDLRLPSYGLYVGASEGVCLNRVSFSLRTGDRDVRPPVWGVTNNTNNKE